MSKRLINTSELRGIDESKINEDQPDDDLFEEETTPGVEEKIINTPQELIDNKQSKKIDEMNETEIEEKYLEILEKINAKKDLTDKEKNFKKMVDEAIAKADEQRAFEQRELELKEKEKSLEEKEKFLAEYSKVKEADPSKIIKANDQEVSLKGGESIPYLINFIIQMKRAKKKGGKILVQVFRNKRVVIKWTLNDVAYVEFFSKDEKGNELIEVTRFNEFIYTYEGTPIPVLFAVQGIAEGYSFFEKFQTSLTSEMVSRLTNRAYHSGFVKGSEQISSNKKKSGLLGALTEFMPLILILGLLVMGWLIMQMYGEMTALRETIEALKTSIPMVVQ